MEKSECVLLRVRQERETVCREWPLTRGVALPEGAVSQTEALVLQDETNIAHPAQLRPLAHWPDGSIKWLLVDFQADLMPGQERTFSLRWGAAPAAASPQYPIEITEDDTAISVCTGPLRFAVSKRRFSLVDSAELGRREKDGHFVPERSLVERASGDAWAVISESSHDGGTGRRLYGMGGTCRASLAEDEYTACVEEAGPLRTVIRCSGAYQADIPMHHYVGYRPLRLITRLYAYAGRTFIRVVHTVVFTGSAREVGVCQLGLHLPLTAEPTARYITDAVRRREQSLADGEYALLAQESDDYFQLIQSDGRQREKRAEGTRCGGWVLLDRDDAAAGVALRYMAEEYPKALGASASGIDIFLWHSEEDRQLRYQRYSEDVAWHEGEGVYGDGLGSAKSSEFFLCFGADAAAVESDLCATLHWPCVTQDERSATRAPLLGNGQRQGHDESERMLDGFVEWMQRQIERERWYGYLDWGDVLATWEEGADAWRFRGRWGWCNSEWDPRHAIWLHFLRTGQRRSFDLAEAMTRHSLDVDTCHYHPLRPYWVGGCYRHSMDHFGDEPCASHTFIDNWVDLYYLTGDGRAREVIEQAGTFFMNYRWTEDPRYSFSLRSIANVLRGLLYAYEVTGQEHFMRRAESVYDVIARGQNADGSWHKRFQVSTEDKLPDQAPYGMATEGSTLAVEMNTAPPFSDDEFRALGGSFSALKKVLPYAEQKGYQTHYLLIGLELMHRLTGRDDVAQTYLHAVDWFCGGPEAFSTDHALGQHYYGILCGSLARAYSLTDQKRYLAVGQAILRHLRSAQDWSENPNRRGAVAMTPTALSLVYFGVPPLLAALTDAGMEE